MRAKAINNSLNKSNKHVPT